MGGMRPHLLLTALAATTVLSACAAEGQVAAPGPSASPSPSLTEVSALQPRAVISHSGGLLTLDLATGETIASVEDPGFYRLNDAGDGRHVLVTDGDSFRVFDAALSAEGHDDHHHYYAGEPGFTGVEYPADKAGHVVAHAGRTVLFGDGDGSIQIIATDAIARADAFVRRLATDAPHHGVALEMTDGSLFTTQGTEDSRSVLQVKRGSQVSAETDACPGSHGEATAQPTEAGDVVVIGCTDGPMVYRDGAFHKIPVLDEYSRSGNLAGSEISPVVLGDYKADPEADLERPTRVALIDTRTARLRVLDLGSSYWFRSLARGPHGEGLVLTYDGSLQVIDVDGGAVSASIPVIAPWAEKEQWQEAGPILKVSGDLAYVTDAERQELVVIDLEQRKVTARHSLEVSPVELAVVTGLPEMPHDHA